MRATSVLGYRPTSVEEAIKQAYEFFVEQGQIEGAVARPRAAAKPAVEAPIEEARPA